MELSLHGLAILLGVAIAGLAAAAAIAVGPYGRRGLRLAFSLISFAAVLATSAWIWIYLGFIDQRRSMEARLVELRGQALASGSALACLERAETVLTSACEQMLFATPDFLSAATLYTGARLDLLEAATSYRGPRTPHFNLEVAGLQRSLQSDTFGLTAYILTVRRGCTIEHCESLSLFEQPQNVQANLQQRAFEANAARYANYWRATPSDSVRTLDSARAPTTSAPSEGSGRAPGSGYSFPYSVPPASIMNDEPEDRSPPPPPKEAVPQAAVSKQNPETVSRRDIKRQNAPLSIVPKQ